MPDAGLLFQLQTCKDHAQAVLDRVAEVRSAANRMADSGLIDPSLDAAAASAQAAFDKITELHAILILALHGDPVSGFDEP